MMASSNHPRVRRGPPLDHRSAGRRAGAHEEGREHPRSHHGRPLRYFGTDAARDARRQDCNRGERRTTPTSAARPRGPRVSTFAKHLHPTVLPLPRDPSPPPHVRVSEAAGGRASATRRATGRELDGWLACSPLRPAVPPLPLPPLSLGDATAATGRARARVGVLPRLRASFPRGLPRMR